MNVFVCSVKSHLEVSSRDYCIASDERTRLLFGSWFELGVSVVKFSHPCLVSVFFTGPSLLKMFFQKFFTLSSVGMGQVQNGLLVHTCTVL